MFSSVSRSYDRNARRELRQQVRFRHTPQQSFTNARVLLPVPCHLWSDINAVSNEASVSRYSRVEKTRQLLQAWFELGGETARHTREAMCCYDDVWHLGCAVAGILVALPKTNNTKTKATIRDDGGMETKSGLFEVVQGKMASTGAECRPSCGAQARRSPMQTRKEVQSTTWCRRAKAESRCDPRALGKLRIACRQQGLRAWRRPMVICMMNQLEVSLARFQFQG